jgi:hypothetical protein
VTTETRLDPTHPRLIYVIIAVVALGLAFDMTFTNKLFPAPSTVADELGVVDPQPLLSEAGLVLQGRYRFAAAVLTVEAGVALLWLLAETRRSRGRDLVVGRSSLRLYAFAALAVPAIFVAVDMTRTHHFAPPAETTSVVVGQTTDESGATTDITQLVLTDVGQTEQRRDLFLGVALFVGGLAALGWACKELMSPTSFLIADDEGLLVRVDGPGRPPRRFPWEGIIEVRSGFIEDDGDEQPVLSIRLFDIEEVPYLPAGGRAEPPWLHLYADEWSVPAHQIAPLLDQRAARPRPTGDYE